MESHHLSKFFSFIIFFLSYFSFVPIDAKKESANDITFKGDKNSLYVDIIKRLGSIDYQSSDNAETLVSQNHKQKSGSQSHGRQTCESTLHTGTIIKATESLSAGAAYLDSIKGVKSNELCSEYCCRNISCDIAVYQDKEDRFCYLFNCHGKCIFKEHAGYYVTDLKHGTSEQPAEEDLHSLNTETQTDGPIRSEGSKKDSRLIGQEEGDVTDIRHEAEGQVVTEAAPQVVISPSPTELQEPVITPHSVGLGGYCTQSIQCEDPNAGCLDHNCNCKNGYYNKDGLCRKVCAPSYFECFELGTLSRGPECVARSQVCDSYMQCADGSDEFNCDHVAAIEQFGSPWNKNSKSNSNLQQAAEPKQQLQSVEQQGSDQPIENKDAQHQFEQTNRHAVEQSKNDVSAQGSSVEHGNVQRKAGFSNPKIEQVLNPKSGKANLPVKSQTNPDANPNSDFLTNPNIINPNQNRLNLSQNRQTESDNGQQNLSQNRPAETDNEQQNLSYNRQTQSDHEQQNLSQNRQTESDNGQQNHLNHLSAPVGGPDLTRVTNADVSAQHRPPAQSNTLEGQGGGFPSNAAVDQDKMVPPGDSVQDKMVPPGDRVHLKGPISQQVSATDNLVDNENRHKINSMGQALSATHKVQNTPPPASNPFPKQLVSRTNGNSQDDDSASKTKFSSYPRPGKPRTSDRQSNPESDHQSNPESDHQSNPESDHQSNPQKHLSSHTVLNSRKWLDPGLYVPYGLPDRSPQQHPSLQSSGNQYLDSPQYYPPYSSDNLDMLPNALLANIGSADDFSQFGGPYLGHEKSGAYQAANQNPAYPGYPDSAYGSRYAPSSRYDYSGEYRSPTYQENEFYPGQAAYKPAAGVFEDFPSGQRLKSPDVLNKLEGNSVHHSSHEVNLESNDGQTLKSTGPKPTFLPTKAPPVVTSNQPNVSRPATSTERPPQPASTAKPVRSHSNDHVFMSSEKLIIASATSNAEGPIIALSLGLAFTVILLVLVGCRLRNVRHRLRKGRPLHQNEADYLINGMYL